MTNNSISTTAYEARALLERAVENLIAFLDLIEPDVDLEDGGDAEKEPDREDGGDDELSLGWQNEGSQGSLRQSRDDLEDEHDGREPSEDYEPSMGWCNPNTRMDGGLSQRTLHGESSDGESEPELGWTEMEARSGSYADEWTDAWVAPDGESSLGWQNTGSQARLHASRDDREEQCEDEGADHDGLEPEGCYWPTDGGARS